jgi:hypothetical protein
MATQFHLNSKNLPDLQVRRKVSITLQAYRAPSLGWALKKLAQKETESKQLRAME